jgi:isoleucyl-tRNA synthetase
VAHEVNVKEVRLAADIEAFASFRLAVNARAVGPRLGEATKRVLAAARAGDWSRDAAGEVCVAGERLAPGEYELRLEPRPGVECQALPGGDLVVVLDFTLTERLVQEGRARDLVRVVQQARRDAGLHVSDRIRLSLRLPPEWRESVAAFRDYVAASTLAAELDLDGRLDGEALVRQQADLGGASVEVALARLGEPAAR